MLRKDNKFERDDRAWKLKAVKLNAFGEETDKYRDVDTVDIERAGFVPIDWYTSLQESYRNLQGSYIRSNS